MKRVAIIGTDGIPNHHGGFERLAEHLSMALVRAGHRVTVYNTAGHPFRGDDWNGVRIIRKQDMKRWLGPASPFLYDLLCIFDSRDQYDVIIQLGYTTSAIYQWMIPKRTRLVTNMDGLEWSRRKYPALVRWYLRGAEKLAALRADPLIADHPVIAQYLMERYGRSSNYIPYGAELPTSPDPLIPGKFGVEAGKYLLLVARLQPDNHIREIIEAHLASRTGIPLVVVGPHRNRFGRKIYAAYKGESVILTGGIYDKHTLDALRFYSLAQLHGHSAGGTNPSLLEAMAAGAPICAHDNPFNRYILGSNSWFFRGTQDLVPILQAIPGFRERTQWAAAYRQRLESEFTWDAVTDAYLKVIDGVGIPK